MSYNYERWFKSILKNLEKKRKNKKHFMKFWGPNTPILKNSRYKNCILKTQWPNLSIFQNSMTKKVIF